MRSKYAEYPEYHTSLDNLDFVTPSGLAGGFNVVKKCLEAIEFNFHPICTQKCEPQLGKRGLYPLVAERDSGLKVRNMMNFLAYADGKLDLIEIAEKINIPIWELYRIADDMLENELIIPK